MKVFAAGLLALALIQVPRSLRAAVWTVCAAACDDTTILAAYTGAASGDTIELEGNVQESDNLTRGINITVESGPGGPYTWDATPGSTNPTLQFQNGNGAAFVMEGVIMDNSSVAGGYDIYWNNSGTSISISASVLERTSTSTNNNALIYEVGADSHSIDLYQSSLVGSGFDYGFYYSEGNDSSVLIENCLLYGFTNSPYAAVYADRNNSWGGVNLQNDTFFNNNWGYYDASTSANLPAAGEATLLEDNLFIGETGDVFLDPDLNVANTATMDGTLIGNGFGTQTLNAAYGPGNLYGLTAVQEFVNPLTSGTPDLHEIAGAPSICAAVNDAAIPSNDKDGNVRPSGDCSDGVPADENGAGYDIGAYQYEGPAQSPTVTPTFSATESFTAGPTATPTATPSLTSTLTATPAASPTLTFTLSPSPAATATGPFTLTPHYPNPDPANGNGVYLPYTISAPAGITMKVYDVSGELVRSWSTDPQTQATGTYERLWDIRNTAGHLSASGVFLVEIKAVPVGPGDPEVAWEKCAVAR